MEFYWLIYNSKYQVLVSESVFVCIQEHELRIIEAGKDKKRFCTIANHKLPAHIHTSTILLVVLNNNNNQLHTNPTTLYQSAHPGNRNRYYIHVSYHRGLAFHATVTI